MMKKIVSMLMAAILVVSPMGNAAVNAGIENKIAVQELTAASPGAGFEDAGELTVNTEYSVTRSVVTSTLKSEYFYFDLPSQGFVNFEFQSEEAKNNNISVNAVAGSQSIGGKTVPFTASYMKTVSSADKETGYDMGLGAGRYYLVVSTPGANDKGYSIKVTFEANASCETEENNTREKANTIAENVVLEGAPYQATDVDYYKFTATEDGYINVNIKHALIGAEDGNITAYTLNAYKAETTTPSGTRTIKGNELDVWSDNITVRKDTDYYIAVTGTTESLGKHYTISVKQTKADISENIDPGSSYANAVQLELNREYVVSENATYDYFYYDIPKQGIVNVEFQRKGSTGSYTVNFNIKERNVSGGGSGISLPNIDVTTPFIPSYFITVSDSEKHTGYDYGLAPGADHFYLAIGKTNSTLAGYTLKLTYQESDICETEENDSVDTADTINDGVEYIGTAHSIENLDYFKYTATENGYLTVNLKHPAISTSGDSGYAYTVKVYSAEAKDSYIYSKAVKGSETELSSIPIGVKKDTVYYISVLGSVNSLGVRYTLSAKATNSDRWEGERNDSVDTANVVEANKQYSGVILRGSDVDFYKFTAPDNGHMSVNLSHEKPIVGYENTNTYHIYIYDSKAAKDAVASLDSIKGATLSADTPELSVKKGQEYYIKVEGNSYCEDVIYGFKVNCQASDAWEQEKNDSYDTANVIESGKEYYGSTGYLDDIDYYKITLKKNGYLTLDLSQKANVSGKIYKLAIVESKTFKTVYETYINGLENKFTMTKLGLVKGDYFIGISVGSKSNLYTGTYALKAKAVSASNWEREENNDFTTATPIKVGKETKGSTLGNYSGSYTADAFDYYKFTLDKGAYVNISMTHKKINGSDTMWYACLYDGKAKTVRNSGMYVKEANKYSESRIVYLPKGAYYIKVAASDAGVDKEYGLTVNKISAKKTTITKLTSSKNRLKLQWKIIPGATKYYIYRSSQKNGKYSLVKTINLVDVNSWTDTKVKKGKTYYYKIKVEVKTKKSKKSGFSAVKKAKV